MSRATVEVAWLDLLAILRISGSSSGFALVRTPQEPGGPPQEFVKVIPRSVPQFSGQSDGSWG